MTIEVSIHCLMPLIMFLAVNIVITAMVSNLYDYNKLDERLKRYVFFEDYVDSWVLAIFLCSFLSLWHVYRVIVANHIQTVADYMKELVD